MFRMCTVVLLWFFTHFSFSFIVFSCTEEKKIVPGIVFNFFSPSCYCGKANFCAFYSCFTKGVNFFFSLTETRQFFFFAPTPSLLSERDGGDV